MRANVEPIHSKQHDLLAKTIIIKTVNVNKPYVKKQTNKQNKNKTNLCKSMYHDLIYSNTVIVLRFLWCKML